VISKAKGNQASITGGEQTLTSALPLSPHIANRTNSV
jgi:hypothetical protein